MSKELETAFFQKIIEAGEKKIAQNFERILQEFQQIRQQDRTPEQLEAVDAVIQAYELARELSMSAFQFKKTLQAQSAMRR